MIRIVGLSATLPNYRDVARFLGVNADTGEGNGRPLRLTGLARSRGTQPSRCSGMAPHPRPASPLISPSPRVAGLFC